MLKPERVLLAVLLSGLSIFYYSKTISDFPSHIHSWTQSGYYALALGFIDNRFNFFLPNTPNLDPQFPAKKELSERKGITSVNFPIHPFVISIIMYLTGSKSPFIFRLYNLLWGITGIFFLFKLTEELTKSFLKSIFIVLFAFTSPVFIYYQAGFIPSIPSFSAAIIGIYYFMQYINTDQQKIFFAGIIFLTLSALTRSPFAIFLASAFFISILKWLNERRINLKILLPYCVSFIVFISYFLYNKYLAEKYGTMYLGKFLYANSWNEFKEILNSTLNNWGYHFFTQWHYIGLILCFGFSVYFLILKRTIIEESKFFLIYALLSIGGALLYFILMEQQFADHDYYFLDSLFLPVLLLLTFFLCCIPLEKNITKIIFGIMTVLLSCGSILNNNEIQEERNTFHVWDRGEFVTNDFVNSGKYLDSLHISRTAKILALETYSPYSSLILMERKGYTVINTDRANLSRAFGFDYDYMVMPNDLSVSDVIRNYPEMISLLEKIGDNGKISIYKKDLQKKQKSIYDFMGINSSNILYKGNLVSDSTRQVYETLNDSIEFGKTFSVTVRKANCKGLEKIFFTSSIHFLSEENNLQAVCSVKRQSETIGYSSFSISKKTSGQQEEEIQFRLPDNLQSEDEIGIYLWNAGKSKIEYGDLQFIIYK